MKRFAILALVLIMVVSSFVLASCGDNNDTTSRFSDSEYLVFLDDFDGELDTSVWNVHDELRRGGYWDKDCAYTKDGKLVLSTVERDGKYYMGAIDSCNKYERAYGYYEALCYLPAASGIWSAFWLMPQTMHGATTDDVNVCGAEIDIMESPYYNPLILPKDKETYQCAVHVGDYGDHYKKTETLINSATEGVDVDVKIYGDWHTFGVEWTKTYYRFYYDRNLVYEVTDSALISPLKNYLFLSVEIGGSNGVAAKPDFIFANSVDKNPEGTFPIEFLVDYVAVFSQKPF